MTAEAIQREPNLNQVPIFPIPRDNPTDAASWGQIMSQPFANEKDRQVLESIKAHSDLLAGLPYMLRVDILVIDDFYLPTVIFDSHRIEEISVEKTEEFIDSLSEDTGAKIGYTVGWSDNNNSAQFRQYDETSRLRALCVLKIQQ